MTLEHVGKKRRKEVREAVNMRKVKRQAGAILAAVMIGGSAIDIAVAYYMFVVTTGDALSTAAQMVPTIIAFALLFLVAFQWNHYSAIAKKLRGHCAQYGITKADMDELAAEDKRQ